MNKTYIGSNSCPAPGFFQKKAPYRGEFGDALGDASMIAHAKEWLTLFKITGIEIIDLNTDGDIIVCNYLEIAEQIKPFKTIEPTSRVLNIKNSVALGITNDKVTHYCLVKDIEDLTLQMVRADQEKCNDVLSLPFFSTLHHMHVKVISEHLKSNDITLSTDQVKYLCGYFIGAAEKNEQKTLGLPDLGDSNHKADIEKLFNASNEEDVRRKLRGLNLAELLLESFTLLKYPSIEGYDANKPCFGQNMHLTDNSKYLL
ncbi:hypothetical protein HRU45_00260 [Candidatus Dependentiae bacterium]|nr:hypothetical protein [Candidatus Dependentiae bacterium]